MSAFYCENASDNLRIRGSNSSSFIANDWIAPNGSVEMKYLLKNSGDRAVIGIRDQNIAHVPAPFLTYRRLSDGLPAFLVLYLDVTEQTIRRGVEEDGVTVHAVLAENLLQLRPYGIMPPFVLLLTSWF